MFAPLTIPPTALLAAANKQIDFARHAVAPQERRFRRFEAGQFSVQLKDAFHLGAPSLSYLYAVDSRPVTFPVGTVFDDSK